MKVAAITFHNSSNYGSVLQTFALQEAVKRLGHDYEIVDFSTPEKYKFDSLTGRNREMGFGLYLYKLLSLPYNYYKMNKFVNFRKKFLNITNRRHKSIDSLYEICNDYDCWICGSDQVWNASMVRFDPTYFLEFIKDENKKISYAASFGKTIWTEAEKSFYKEQLKNFKKISVREQSALHIVEECSNKKADLVVDPTLLLTKEQWIDISKKEKIEKEPYILTYCLSNNVEMQKFIKKLKYHTGYKVVRISRGIVPMLKEGLSAVPSPLEFVKLFANASYIVTNSFHGTAFSTNLNKNFFTFVSGDRNVETNSRIVDFLEKYELSERIMVKCPKNISKLTIENFEKTNSLLMEERYKSFKFLEKSLNIMDRE